MVGVGAHNHDRPVNRSLRDATVVVSSRDLHGIRACGRVRVRGRRVEAGIIAVAHEGGRGRAAIFPVDQHRNHRVVDTRVADLKSDLR